MLQNIFNKSQAGIQKLLILYLLYLNNHLTILPFELHCSQEHKSLNLYYDHKNHCHFHSCDL